LVLQDATRSVTASDPRAFAADRRRQRKIEDDRAFMIPSPWISTDVDGTSVFRPADSNSFQVAMDVTKTTKTLSTHVAEEFADYTVERTDIDGIPISLASSW
jgi:hypothetical protein